jgi:hypothetical protein
MAEHALSRGEMKRLIVTAFHTNERLTKNTVMTVARTARMCGYVPSQKFRDIMNEMVKEEILESENWQDVNSISGNVVIYSLNKDRKTEAEKPREIIVNGQLGLWS